jgi:hemerythrin
VLEWKDQYSCNIVEVDKQHKHLFQLTGELHELLKMGDKFDRYDDINKVLANLADYTVYHFSYEEKLLKEYGFDPAEYRTHEAEHIAFVKKIRHLMDQDIDKEQHKILMDALLFAVNWIEKHILETDKKYMPFLNGKGIY